MGLRIDSQLEILRLMTQDGYWLFNSQEAGWVLQSTDREPFLASNPVVRNLIKTGYLQEADHSKFLIETNKARDLVKAALV